MWEISCVLACVLGASLLDVFWRERAIWLFVNACLRKIRSGLLPKGRVGWDGDGECSLSAPKDRVDLPLDVVSTFVQTARLAMGGGAGRDS
jgi:hypothetical protein